MFLNFCVFCGTEDGIEHHHVRPRSEGGGDEPTNILTVCGTHHGLLHDIRRPANISTLIKNGLAAARARGVYAGNPNWVKTERLMASAPAVKAAWAAHARGLSLRAIAAELAAAGHLNAHGRTYAAQSIRRILATSRSALQQPLSVT